jgi:hypothetical protein
LFYAPKNKDFASAAPAKPPLLVISHGGPTSATTSALRLSVQYWTSRGFGVVDVNYGGSTGYGRAYRQVLTNDLIGVSPGLSPSTLARWNPATQAYSTIVSVTYPQANLAVDSNMRAPFSDSYSIGLDRQLMKNVGVGASYIHKHGQDQIGWLDIGGCLRHTEFRVAGWDTITAALLNPTRESSCGCRARQLHGYSGLVLLRSAWRTGGGRTLYVFGSTDLVTTLRIRTATSTWQVSGLQPSHMVLVTGS